MFQKKTALLSQEKAREVFEALKVKEIDFQMECEFDPQENPRLAPLVMFREIWGAAVSKGDTEWLEGTIKHFEMRKSLTGIAAAKWPENDEFLNALKAVVESGIDLRHITAIVRQAQEHLLSHVGYVLSYGSADGEGLEGVHWAIYETDEDRNPGRRMDMLHQLFGLADPDDV